MASVEVPLLVNRADDDVSSDDGTRQPSNATASSIEEETAAPVRYQSKGKRFLNYLKNADWDRYLAYHANKIVKIKDWRLAVLDYSLVGVVLFIVFYVFLYTKEAYKATDSGQGALKISIVDPGNIPATAPYCSSNCHTFSGTEPGCECIFLDENDVVYPESEEYSTFITTKFSRHIQQTKKDFCNDSVCTSPWTEGAQDSYYVLNPDEFIIQTFHVSLAPKFLSEDVLDHNGQLPSAHTYNSKYMSSSFQLWGHVLDSTGEPILLLPPRKSDQIPLKVYLQAAGLTLEDVQETGTLLRAVIVYGDCKDMAPNDEQSKAYCANATSDTNYYQYQVTLGQPQYWVEQTFYSLDYTERTVKNGTGVRVVFSITGVYSKFSFNAMMTTLVSIYMFFSFVTYTVDFVLLFLLPDRKLYGLSKYEVTDNFSELHASEVAKSGLKVQLEQARKVALYKQTSDVTALLNDMKAVVSPDHLDQLALACMDIFVQIKNDYPSAEQCFEQFILGDHSKCMANILLNHLREAYLVAINANSLEDVYMVLDAAKKAGNTSVEALCEKFLGSE